MAKRLTIVMFLLLSTNLIAQSNNKYFGPLESNSRLSGDYGHDIKITVEAKQVPLTASLFTEYKKKVKIVTGADWDSESDLRLYKLNLFKYVYKFENLRSNKIKLNFEWEFANSPFTDIIQDFSLPLNGKEVRTISFIADTIPVESSTPVNIGTWVEKLNKWLFYGTGRATTLVPERYYGIYLLR